MSEKVDVRLRVEVTENDKDKGLKLGRREQARQGRSYQHRSSATPSNEASSPSQLDASTRRSSNSQLTVGLVDIGPSLVTAEHVVDLLTRQVRAHADLLRDDPLVRACGADPGKGERWTREHE